MTTRALIVTVALFLAPWGCSQNASPVPNGPAQSAAAHVAGGALALPTVKYFNTPTFTSWPTNITAGPEKSLWFSEEFVGSIGRVSTDGAITEFPDSNGQETEGITQGGDGNIWFTEPGANMIGRMTPAGASTVYAIDGEDPDPRNVALGPDGNVWYTEFNDGYIGRITPSGTITRFQIPDQSPGAWDITAGPDGDLWFTESQYDAIGRFDPKALQFKPSIQVPTPGSTPWGILFAPDKHIWFTERTGDKIGEVAGRKIREFKIPQPESYPEKLAPGSDGDLWIPESQVGDVGRIDPATGRFARSIRLPSYAIPEGIAEGANGNLFVTIASYHEQNQVAEVMLR
jgi:streptogramin lyase